MQVIKTIIADDHPIYLEGLKCVLQKHPKFSIEIVGIAENGQELIHLLRRIEADILILDLNMPEKDGFEVMEEIPRSRIKIKTIVQTMYEDPKIIKNAFKVGANAYILKNTGEKELFTAINTVLEGDSYMGLNVTIAKLANTNKTEKENRNKYQDKFTKKYNLTKRELEVLKLIAHALSNKEIGKELYISDQTVSVHRKNIMRKLNVSNTAGLVKMAYDNNLV